MIPWVILAIVKKNAARRVIEVAISLNATFTLCSVESAKLNASMKATGAMSMLAAAAK